MKLEPINLTAKEILNMETSIVKLCQLPFTDFRDIMGCTLMFKRYEDLVLLLKKAQTQIQKSFFVHTESGTIKTIRAEACFHEGKTLEDFEAANTAFLEEKHDLEVHFLESKKLEPFTKVHDEGKADHARLTAVDFVRLSGLLK